MVPPIGYFEALKFAAALSVFAGAMAWWHKGGPKEDELIAEAADVVIDTISDGDKVSKIERATGRNLRDQISVEEAKQIDEERRWHRWPRRN